MKNTKKIKSLQDLLVIKKKLQNQMEPDDGIRIVVGVGTCGVAAGGKPVYDAIVNELKACGLPDIIHVVPVGCVGICQFEPVVEVYEPGNVRTTYVHMTPERAQRVVQQHIRGGNPLSEFTIGAARSGR